jgi:hypothetical protein
VAGLGYAGMEPDTRNPEAIAWFKQGVRFIWAFDEVEAVRAFQMAQKIDPPARSASGEKPGRGARPSTCARVRRNWMRPAKPRAAPSELAGKLSPADRCS